MEQNANSLANLKRYKPRVAVGEHHERWTILSRAENSSDRKRRWLCRCDCGVEKIVYEKCILRRESLSCGCFRAESFTRHGYCTDKNNKKAREYGIYQSMIQRCHNENNTGYSGYGALGTAVCQRWRDDFKNFIEDMGPCPTGMTIDRIDGTKGYFKENCRWATYAEQARNKSTNVIVDVHGEKMCITDWANKIGMNVKTIMYRWAKWKDVDRVEKTPLLHPYFKGKRILKGECV